jgi:hypothetical protein
MECGQYRQPAGAGAQSRLTSVMTFPVMRSVPRSRTNFRLLCAPRSFRQWFLEALTLTLVQDFREARAWFVRHKRDTFLWPVILGPLTFAALTVFAGAPNTLEQMAPQMGGANETENLLKLNSLGFRIERPLEKSKPAGELRIFVVGGSTVFMGAPLAKTIPGQIESELLRRGISGAKVYNFGAVSFVSGQELA